ncbi:TlpA family protein disulfide reductase [Pedobacter metabolipauper]|nr:thioredoxin-like domain-containing protein [Pedobacter metabolipauper]
MKTKIVLLFALTIITCFFHTQLKAQNKPPKFSGTFAYSTDTILDAIDFRTMKENIWWGELIPYIVSLKNKNHFSCIMDKLKEPQLLQINFMKSGKHILVPGEYYVEMDDDIKIGFFKVSERDSLVFSGKGSEKYNLINAVKQQQNKFKDLTSKLNNPKSNKDLQVYLNEYTKLALRFMYEQSSLINKYDGVNKSMKKLIGYEFDIYQTYWANILLYFYLYDKNYANETSRKIVKDALNNGILSFNTPDSISVLAPVQYMGLLFRMKVKMVINNEPTNLASFYKRLKENYTGLVRERLMVEFLTSTSNMSFITSYKPDVYDSIIVDASNSVVHPYYKELIEKKGRTRKGSKVLNAEFTDLLGKPFKIESMKGKVVLIDAWSVGCTGCALFHKLFESRIHPFFKNNPDFKVLSINADKSHERWIEGLNSGKFSANEYLNVGVGELGINHPFFKYYTNAMPLLLIVDKEGRLITKLSGVEKIEEIVDVINIALNEKNIK